MGALNMQMSAVKDLRDWLYKKQLPYVVGSSSW